MARRKKHEEHTNHEAWAIPYADLMTLLLAFFVVMYAISSVNEGKYRVLSESLTNAFSGSPKTVDPVQVGDSRQSDPDAGRPMPIPSAARHGAPRPSPMLEPALRPLSESGMRTGEGLDEAVLTESRQQLTRIALELEEALADMVRTRQISIRHADLWLEVEINSDVLFDTASATLEPYAQSLLARLARLLRDQPNAIRVEGHTDNRPINTARFPSNWELSAARAASVVHLFAREQVEPERLVMVGYGEHRPKVAETSDAARDANRRVVLMVLAAPGTEGARPADVPESLAANPAAPVADVPAAAAAGMHRPAPVDGPLQGEG